MPTLIMEANKELSPEPLLNLLKTRFEKNRHRHHGLDWAKLETTGGEPQIEQRMNTLFVIAPPKHPKVAAIFAMMELDSSRAFRGLLRV